MNVAFCGSSLVRDRRAAVTVMAVQATCVSSAPRRSFRASDGLEGVPSDARKAVVRPTRWGSTRSSSVLRVDLDALSHGGKTSRKSIDGPVRAGDGYLEQVL